MEEIDLTKEPFVPRKLEFGAWEEWFAWRPVKVKGQRVWLKKVFRRCINTYVDMDDWKRWEYGTVLDVLADDQQPTYTDYSVLKHQTFKGQQDG